MVTSNLKFYFKDRTAIHYIYGILFTLSIVIINPLGDNWGNIWNGPKLLAIQLIVIFNLLLVLRHAKMSSVVIPTACKIGFCLWLLFLGIGIIATLLSPAPSRSFWGHIFIGDGFYYWFFVAAFCISNALVLYLNPKLARYQLYGLLAGGVILALAIFVQVYDWRIDFTATSGLVSKSNPQRLRSEIWKAMMPIGFYTNRGEAALPLAIEALVALLGLLWGWISAPIAGTVYVSVCTALFYTKCRGALLGLLVALIYLLVIFRSDSTKRLKIICHGFGLLVVSYFLFRMTAVLLTPDFTLRSSPRNFKLDVSNLDSSIGRLQHWKLGLKGIALKPWFGWGFNGFGTAFPFVGDWTGEHQGYLLSNIKVSEILDIGNFSFKYLGADGNEHMGLIMAAKAHNFIIDTAISVGILGLLSYLSIFTFSIWCAFNSTSMGIEATAIAYLVYTMTWYESGQFSHLGWWGLSVGLGCTKLFQGKK